jgi:endonuclease VIII-like 1
MPELSEVKIMSEFINAIQDNSCFFDTIEKSPESKVNTELDIFGGTVFTIRAESRGKELMLILEQVGDIEGATKHKLLCNMGMSGNWVYIRKNSIQLEKALKHSHLRFQTTSGNWLLLHDVRRFAKWRWVDDWSSNRGPCPLTEYNQFAEYLKTNWQKSKDFDKPLCEFLMNQKWFNGIGNYIRAEVLYRLDVDPFQPAKNLILGEINQLITIIHLAFRDTYAMGGGQLKDWKNPNGSSEKNFNEWIKCYSKSSSSCIIDKSGRKFWFDAKWLNSPNIKHLQK